MKRNMKIKTILLVGILTLGIGMVGCKSKETNETPSEVIGATESTSKTLDDIKGQEVVTLEDLRLVAKTEFGESNEESDYTMEVVEASEITYGNTKTSKSVKTEGTEIQEFDGEDLELELKKIEFMRMFNKAFAKYVDTQLEKELTYENYKNWNEESNLWYEFLAENGNIDTKSQQGTMLYVAYADAAGSDLVKVKEIRNMLSVTENNSEKEQNFSDIKAQIIDKRSQYDEALKGYIEGRMQGIYSFKSIDQ